MVRAHSCPGWSSNILHTVSNVLKYSVKQPLLQVVFSANSLVGKFHLSDQAVVNHSSPYGVHSLLHITSHVYAFNAMARCKDHLFGPLAPVLEVSLQDHIHVHTSIILSAILSR
jgi:hypothetical protein